MPKMKTHKGAKKRFTFTGTGKIKRGQVNKNHILEKKAPKRKRQLRPTSLVAEVDAPSIRRALGKR